MRYVLFSLLLALLAVGFWGELSCAQGLDVSIKSKGFRSEGPKKPPSAAIFADALIGRPVGAATTVVGATVWTVMLPFTLPARAVRPTAKALVIKPAGWTFKRPLAGSDPRFRDEGVFPYP